MILDAQAPPSHYMDRNNVQKIEATPFWNGCKAGHVDLEAGKLPNTYDTDSEGLGESDVGRSS